MEVFKKFYIIEILKMFDCMKDFGFKILIKVGMIVGIVDILIFEEKYEIFEKVYDIVEKIIKLFCCGLIIDDERYECVIGVWNVVKDEI